MSYHERSPTRRDPNDAGSTGRGSEVLHEHGLRVEAHVMEGNAIVVRLEGEADLHTAPRLRDALADAIAARPAIIVVDMTGVTFVDSMMLGVMLGATRESRPRGTEFRIVVDDAHVRRIFEITLLDRVLPLYPDLELALRCDRDVR